MSEALKRMIETRDTFIEATKRAKEAQLAVIAAQKNWSMAKDELNQEDKDLLNL